jgi:hypothetical protein
VRSTYLLNYRTRHVLFGLDVSCLLWSRPELPCACFVREVIVREKQWLRQYSRGDVQPKDIMPRQVTIRLTAFGKRGHVCQTSITRRITLDAFQCTPPVTNECGESRIKASSRSIVVNTNNHTASESYQSGPRQGRSDRRMGATGDCLACFHTIPTAKRNRLI